MTSCIYAINTFQFTGVDNQVNKVFMHLCTHPCACSSVGGHMQAWMWPGTLEEYLQGYSPHTVHVHGIAKLGRGGKWGGQPGPIQIA